MALILTSNKDLQRAYVLEAYVLAEIADNEHGTKVILKRNNRCYARIDSRAWEF